MPLMMQSILVSAMFGFAVLLVVTGLASRQQETEEVAERLDRYGGRTPRSLQEVELEAPFSERVLQPTIDAMADMLSRFAPQHLMESQRQKLESAGNPNDWTPADFLGVRGLAAIVVGAIPTILLFLGDAPLLKLAGFAVFFTVIGFMLPVVWLDRRIRERQDSIVKSLPDALDLMTISVEAGLGFDAALAKVTEKWDTDLAYEFGRVISEIRLGKNRRDALRDMAERADVDELTSFVAAIVQADQLGVSIGKVLRVQSEEMRVRRRQRAEEKAQKAPIKMLFPMAFLLMPALFIILLGPAIPVAMDALGGL